MIAGLGLGALAKAGLVAAAVIAGAAFLWQVKRSGALETELAHERQARSALEAQHQAAESALQVELREAQVRRRALKSRLEVINRAPETDNGPIRPVLRLALDELRRGAKGAGGDGAADPAGVE